ncbi:MAG TPA: hypothetical protein VK881_12865 [bacterium]|nr:hypothetical protein [bacterium]
MNQVIKWIVVAVLMLHGLIHVMGFLKEWHLADIKTLTDRTLVPLSDAMSRVLGLAWLGACVLLIYAAAALLARFEKWWIPALLGIGLSQALVILWWNDARAGTVVNIILLGVILLRLTSGRPLP